MSKNSNIVPSMQSTGNNTDGTAANKDNVSVFLFTPPPVAFSARRTGTSVYYLSTGIEISTQEVFT